MVLHVVDAQHAHLRTGVDRFLDLVREVDGHPLELVQLDPELREMLGGRAENGLLDRGQVGGEVGDPHPLLLHLAEDVVDEHDHLVAQTSLDIGRRDGSEGADELGDEVVRRADPPTVGSENPEVHEPEIGVPEDVRLRAPEFPVKDAALQIVDLGLLPDARERLDEVPQEAGVERGQGSTGRGGRGRPGPFRPGRRPRSRPRARRCCRPT